MWVQRLMVETLYKEYNTDTSAEYPYGIVI